MKNAGEKKNMLILGGTHQAWDIAQKCAPLCYVTLSLAGLVVPCAKKNIKLRMGGFGGEDGLCDYLAQHKIDALIDATHPFATHISKNALRASMRVGISHMALRRLPWTQKKNDRWYPCASIKDVPALIKKNTDGGRVFLSLGGRGAQELCERLYDVPCLIRFMGTNAPSIPPLWRMVRGAPLSWQEEEIFLQTHEIVQLVSRNSGGETSYGKIKAARHLGLPVVMLTAPAMPHDAVSSVEEVMTWCFSFLGEKDDDGHHHKARCG